MYNNYAYLSNEETIALGFRGLSSSKERVKTYLEDLHFMLDDLIFLSCVNQELEDHRSISERICHQMSKLSETFIRALFYVKENEQSPGMFIDCYTSALKAEKAFSDIMAFYARKTLKYRWRLPEVAIITNNVLLEVRLFYRFKIISLIEKLIEEQKITQEDIKLWNSWIPDLLSRHFIVNKEGYPIQKNAAEWQSLAKTLNAASSANTFGWVRSISPPERLYFCEKPYLLIVKDFRRCQYLIEFKGRIPDALFELLKYASFHQSKKVWLYDFSNKSYVAKLIEANNKLKAS